jgi:hypothetical protein
MSRGPCIPDRRAAQALGVAFIVLGAFCLHDAYEARGQSRPFLTRFLPG